MSYIPIDNNEIIVGAPIDQNLLTKVKGNFDQLKAISDTQAAEIVDLKIPNPWISVSYNGNWTGYNGGYAPASYYKDDNGRVHLRGLVVNPSAGTAASLVFQLPVGYRPQYRAIFTVNFSGGFGRVDITADGSVISQNGTSSVSYLSLEGISFKAEQ